MVSDLFTLKLFFDTKIAIFAETSLAPRSFPLVVKREPGNEVGSELLQLNLRPPAYSPLGLRLL